MVKKFFQNLFDAIIPLTPLIGACLFSIFHIIAFSNDLSSTRYITLYYTSITKQHRTKQGWLGAFCAAWLFYLFGIMTYGVIIYLLFVYSAVSYYALYVSRRWDRIIAGWCTLLLELRGVIFLPLELALTCLQVVLLVKMERCLPYYTDYTGAYAIIYGLTGALFVYNTITLYGFIAWAFAVMRTVYTTRAIWLYH